jgi:hypothetical protein
MLTKNKQFLLAAGLAYEKSSRATNITYTQMLFALSFDKFFFGHTPDLMSIAGSTLILGSAIYVATMAKAGNISNQKDETEGSRLPLDEEAGQGLISGMRTARDVDTGDDRESMPVQEVQLRTLR